LLLGFNFLVLHAILFKPKLHFSSLMQFVKLMKKVCQVTNKRRYKIKYKTKK